jgi:glycosyltransferase involved in cell wall biosynthesis
MKILQLIFSLSSGGAERFVTDLSNQLSRNHEVTLCIICTDGNPKWSFYKNELSERINYINLKCKKGINLQAFYLVLSLIQRIKPDVVHAHLNTIIYLFIPALFYKHKYKFYHTLHNTAKKTVGYTGQKFLNRFYYKHFIQPVTISDDSDNSFKELYRLNNSKLIVNGRKQLVKTSLFKNVREEVDRYKINTNDTVFLHIGRYNKQKNQKMLIDTFNRLLKENKNVILLIIGTGFDEGRGAKLKKGNQKGIYFLGSKQNISDYLYCSNAFCLSSLWEGLPISILEALSCGVIPICTPAGGIQDVIRNNTYGYISENFSSESYYMAVTKFLDDPNKISPDKLRKYFDINYSISNCAKNYLEIFHSN